MGTALTGLEIKDTYDSLIKVTDNGPLSGTAKYLSDGLGNDSALALSTTALGVGTATPVSRVQIVGTKADLTSIANFQMGLVVDDNTSLAQGIGGGISFRGIRISPSTYSTFAAIDGFKENATAGNYNASLRFLTASNSEGYPVERMRITSAGDVGIGTPSPAATLDVVGTSRISAATPTQEFFNTTNQDVWGSIFSQTSGTGSGASLVFSTKRDGLSATGKMTITQSGVVILAQGQLQFPATQVASADPNTLDDYEEGTWTMGIAFDNGATGVTYSSNTGRYTKIGRQVTVVGYLALTNKGSSTGNATITGLPFTIGSGNSNYSASSISNLANVTFADFPQLRGEIGTTNILFLETTNAGTLTALTNSDFANNAEVIISLTYFV